jgi:hypothetical protein
MNRAQRLGVQRRRRRERERRRADAMCQKSRELARREAASAGTPCWAARLRYGKREACAPHIAAPTLPDGLTSALPDARSFCDHLHPRLTNGPTSACIRIHGMRHQLGLRNQHHIQ